MAAGLGRGPAQAKADQCRLAFQIGIGYLGRPDIEKIEHAVFGIAGVAAEVGVRDRRVATAKFTDKTM